MGSDTAIGKALRSGKRGKDGGPCRSRTCDFVIKSHSDCLKNDLRDNALQNSDSACCSNGCSDTPNLLQQTNLEALAAALQNLTPDDRATLARMLAKGE